MTPTSKDRLYYGWVLVICFVIIGTIIWGTRSTFGVYFKSLESEFELSRAATSLVYSVYMVLCGAVSMPTGWAMDKYGPRIVVNLMGILAGLSLLLTGQTKATWQLFLTYSLLLALGTSGMYTVLMSTVSKWFDKKRGIALGIASLGGGVGTMVLAPLSSFLISSYDWRWAFIITGFFIWVGVLIPSRWLRRDPHDFGLLPDGVNPDTAVSTSGNTVNKKPGSTGLTLTKAMVTRSFWLIMFAYLAHAFCMFLVLTHVVPDAIDVGLSSQQSATVLSLYGFTTIGGRLIFGGTSDRLGKKFTTLISMFLQLSGALCLVWAKDLWFFYLAACIFGLGYGGISPTMAALVGDSFGVRYMGAILGVLNAGFGAGAALGPFFGGYIFDITASYFWAFASAVFAMAIAMLLVSLSRRERQGIPPG